MGGTGDRHLLPGSSRGAQVRGCCTPAQRMWAGGFTSLNLRSLICRSNKTIREFAMMVNCDQVPAHRRPINSGFWHPDRHSPRKRQTPQGPHWAKVVITKSPGDGCGQRGTMLRESQAGPGLKPRPCHRGHASFPLLPSPTHACALVRTRALSHASRGKSRCHMYLSREE